MKLTQLFYKKKDNLLATIKLDAIITESAEANVRLTENPVEQGANVNDHIIFEPLTFSMQGAIVNDFSSNVRTKQTWSDLLSLQANRTVFNLVQGLKTYKNVVLLSLTTQQDVSTANALIFSATLKELILVGQKRVMAEQFKDKNLFYQMSDKVNGGLKQLKDE